MFHASCFTATLVLLMHSALAFSQESVVDAYLAAAEKATMPEEKSRIYSKALIEAVELGDPKMLFKTHVSLGMFEDSQGNYSEAERALKKALEFTSGPLQKAHVNSLIGNMHRNAQQPQEALVYYKQALALREANQPATSWEVANALIGLADCQREIAMSSDAVPHYQKAISILEKQSDRKYQLAMALSGLAQARLAQQDTVAAVTLTDRALAIFEALPEPPAFQVANCLTTLAQIKEKAGNAEEALALYLRAVERYGSTSSILALPALDGAARLWTAAGEKGKAEYFAARAADIRSLRTVRPK